MRDAAGGGPGLRVCEEVTTSALGTDGKGCVCLTE